MENVKGSESSVRIDQLVESWRTVIGGAVYTLLAIEETWRRVGLSPSAGGDQPRIIASLLRRLVHLAWARFAIVLASSTSRPNGR